MLEKVLQIGTLLDFYGALLTKKQARCLEMYYADDLSLAEIAAEFGVSRQAVHDIIRRSEQLLLAYERKLGLAERRQRTRRRIQEAYALVDGLPPDLRAIPDIQRALKKLLVLIEDSGEVRDGF